MDTSFADRLARINSQNGTVAVDPNVDLIGSGGAASMSPLQGVGEPLTYDQRFKKTIVNNILLGILWMAPTAFIGANFFAAADFIAGHDPTAESLFNTQVGLGIALLVSFGLFGWVAREAVKDLGKLHGMPMSLAVGGLLGVALGTGPITLYNLFLEHGHTFL